MQTRIAVLTIGFATAIVAVLGSTRPAAAQTITVTETGGRTTGDGGKTTLEFSSVTQEGVPVNRVLASFQATTGDSATDFSTLCTTPCKLDVVPGFYRLRFGHGGAFDPGVDLNVNGGKRSFDVKPTSYGYLVGGSLLTAAGLVVGLMGFAVTEGSHVDGTNHVSTTGRVMNVTGLAALIFGGYMSFGPGMGSVDERN